MQQIAEILTAVGVPAFGVCRFAELAPFLPCRAAQRLPRGADAVLMCLFPYYAGEYPQRNLSRYAMARDYHEIIRAVLTEAEQALRRAYPKAEFAAFVDSSPIREVYAAYRAGLGFIGKNGQLITGEYGSYCFIGELVTTLSLPAALPLQTNCGGCKLCQKNCPEGAIGENGELVLEKCRSHITQKKGELTPAERESIRQGSFAWGCDCCTDCCPYNKAAKTMPLAGFSTEIVHTLTAENCAGLCETHAFGWRGAAVLRRNLEIIGAD